MKTTQTRLVRCCPTQTILNWGKNICTPVSKVTLTSMGWITSVIPYSRYSYAIVGINLTEMAYSLLRSGALKPHFYNAVEGTPELQHFHQLYCEQFRAFLSVSELKPAFKRENPSPPLLGYLAYEFDKFWVAEEPESIMQFNQYREKFHDKVKTLLQDPDVCLRLTVHSGKK